jgi:hypothetical protein
LRIFSFFAILAYSLVAQSVYAGVVIEAPSKGSVLSSPVSVSAYSNSPASGLSVYLNGTLVAQNKNRSIRTTLTLNPGTYTVSVATQSKWRGSSASVTFTVSDPESGSGSTPAAPQDPSDPSPPSAVSVADQIAADMQGKNEGLPHGVPLSYDWATGPVISMGNNAQGWRAITAWGTLYEAAEGNPAKNTRVNIRNMQTFLLRKSTGKWLLLQSTSHPDGEAYVEDFSGDAHKAADVRTERDGTVSATAGGGYNFHFYPSARASIDPSDIGGIVTIVEARLIVGDPNKPDDRASARYLLGSGADYYPALTGGWPGTADFNPGVGGGKGKYVKTEWRSFAMSTISQSDLERNPPPVDLTGILP